MRNIHDYSSIIHQPYIKSKRHKPMSMADRAAQFSPFAALTGHEELIDETGRYVDEKKELVDDRQYELDVKLALAMQHQDSSYRFIYFQKDSKKKGGTYKETVGTVSKFKDNKIYINDQIIDIADIYDIEEA